MCKKTKRFIEFKYFYFEKNSEWYDFPAKPEDAEIAPPPLTSFFPKILGIKY